MTHLKRIVTAAIAVAVAAVPAILADPSIAHYIAAHPWAAAYLPIVSGVVLAVYHAVKDKRNTSTPAATGATNAGSAGGK